LNQRESCPHSLLEICVLNGESDPNVVKRLRPRPSRNHGWRRVHFNDTRRRLLRLDLGRIKGLPDGRHLLDRLGNYDRAHFLPYHSRLNAQGVC